MIEVYGNGVFVSYHKIVIGDKHYPCGALRSHAQSMLSESYLMCCFDDEFRVTPAAYNWIYREFDLRYGGPKVVDGVKYVSNETTIWFPDKQGNMVHLVLDDDLNPKIETDIFDFVANSIDIALSEMRSWKG